MAESETIDSGLRRTDFHGAIRRNQRNTVWLCAAIILVAALLGYVIGWVFEIVYLTRFAPISEAPSADPWAAVVRVSDWGLNGTAAMSILSGLWIIVALTAGDRIVLRMAGAREASREEAPVLHNVVEEMALAAGLPKPRVALIDSPALNAFATGLDPERSAIAVTQGLIDTLDRDELQGVVAHEMSHIANNDVLYATAVGVVVGLIALVSDSLLRVVRYGRLSSGGRRGGRAKGAGALALIALVILVVCLIVAPLAARLVQMAISRQREYLADATAVKLTRQPRGLIGALEKIDAAPERFHGANRAIQHLFIANPLHKFGDRSGALFSTHPPTPARIERLRDLG